MSSSNGTPRASNFEFPYTTCRNISGPEDEAAGRKVYAGHAPTSSVLQLEDDENVREYLVDEARGRGHVHVGAGILLAKVRCAGAAHQETSVEMNVDHVRPVAPAHAVENAVAQNAGIVGQDVDAAEGVERRPHDLVSVGRLGERGSASQAAATAAASLFVAAARPEPVA
jgi:hypothetical protein